MSNRKQLENFNLQFVKDTMQTWTDCSTKYEKESYRAYSRLRSYLSLYQYRLGDNEKHDIREMLSQKLDDIEKISLIDDMDNYLDGFCFKFDRSIMTNESFTEKSPENQEAVENMDVVKDKQPILQHDITSFETIDCEDKYDQTGIDYYTLQFMQ